MSYKGADRRSRMDLDEMASRIMDTPSHSQVVVELEQLVSDTLERAAAVADALGDRWGSMSDDVYNEGCKDAAKAIRALKNP